MDRIIGFIGKTSLVWLGHH